MGGYIFAGKLISKQVLPAFALPLDTNVSHCFKKTFPDLYPEERDVNALKLVKSVCNRTCLLTVSWRFIDSLKQSPYDMDVSSVEIISGRGGGQ